MTEPYRDPSATADTSAESAADAKSNASETDGAGSGPQVGAPGPDAITADRLVFFFQKWGSRLAPKSEAQSYEFPSEPSRLSAVLFFLKLLPYACIAGFFGSFIYDISWSMHFPWRDAPVVVDSLFRDLSVTGLVGYGTNWLAIKMLFYPRRKRPLLGQGLIPSRKNQIVIRLGEQISKEIINSELIVEQIRKSGLVQKHRETMTASLRGLLEHPEFRSDLLELTQHYITEFLRSRDFQERVKDFVKGIDFENVGVLEGGILRVYKMLTGDRDISGRLQEVITNLAFRMDRHEEKLFNFLNSIPDAMERESRMIEDYALDAMMFLIDQVNVQSVIIDNLQEFDEVRLEQLLWRSTSDQLNYIQYMGCFLGLVGAFFMWVPFESFAFTSALVLSVWGVDSLILRLRDRRRAGS